jgi:hypothetical protein
VQTTRVCRAAGTKPVASCSKAHDFQSIKNQVDCEPADAWTFPRGLCKALALITICMAAVAGLDFVPIAAAAQPRRANPFGKDCKAALPWRAWGRHGLPGFATPTLKMGQKAFRHGPAPSKMPPAQAVVVGLLAIAPRLCARRRFLAARR